MRAMEWLPADDATRARFSEETWSWISETGSLTQRLKAMCDGRFSLHVVDAREAPLDADAAAAMGLAPGARAQRREVELRCAGEACIHAVSWLPAATLAGGGRGLDALGGRPLGDALFAHPAMTRGPIEVAVRDDGTPARRSVFRLAGDPLLVCEYFLPALGRCAH